MEGKITIQNLTGRHLQFRIDHQQVCVKIGRCLCRKGRRGPEALTVHVPGNGKSEPQVPGVALSPEIKAAANGKRPKIMILGHEPKAQAKAVAPTPTPTPTPAGEGKGDGTEESKSSTGRKGQNKGKGQATN